MSQPGTRAAVRLAAFAGAGASLAIASPAVAGWRYATWGMTVSELIDASEGAAERVDHDPGQGIFGQHQLAMGSANENGIELEASFYFDPRSRRLTFVDLVPQPADCDAALGAYKARLGDGEHRHEEFPGAVSGQTATITVTRWTDPDNGDQIQFLDTSVPGANRRLCKVIHGADIPDPQD